MWDDFDGGLRRTWVWTKDDDAKKKVLRVTANFGAPEIASTTMVTSEPQGEGVVKAAGSRSLEFKGENWRCERGSL